MSKKKNSLQDNIFVGVILVITTLVVLSLISAVFSYMPIVILAVVVLYFVNDDVKSYFNGIYDKYKNKLKKR